MEAVRIEDLCFTYPKREEKTLSNISFSVEKGELVTVCGKSGCGKTTLLRLLKPNLSPCGTRTGEIYVNGTSVSELDARRASAEIGFVMQSPEAQIVTDKVWHELAFGLESLGLDSGEIRRRVSEMASFFGIQTWFHKDVSELSGGQKQILCLASVMVMQPSVLILDEPTSQLDPISARELLKTVERINRELGTTVIITEHRLEDALPCSDKVIVLDGGKVFASGTAQMVCSALYKAGHDMRFAMPSPMRIYGALDGGNEPPLTVRDGRTWLEEYARTHAVCGDAPADRERSFGEAVIELSEVYFRYERALPDVINGVSLTVRRGELFALVGGNGTGKSTMLSLICNLNKPYRGSVRIKGEEISRVKDLYGGVLGILPQNPQSLFVKKTVYLDLADVLSGKGLSDAEIGDRIYEMAALCRIGHLLSAHPYDLSGGEQQRAALCKVLLCEPEILILDEPTKGMDAHFKLVFARILRTLTESGVTVLTVSHDIEFCAEYADRCAMLFDGGITSVGAPREFFCGNSFYTTSTNRMARSTLPGAILVSDVIRAFGKEPETLDIPEPPAFKRSTPTADAGDGSRKRHSSRGRIFGGVLFLLLFILGCFLSANGPLLSFVGLTPRTLSTVSQLTAMLGAAGALALLLPRSHSFPVSPIKKGRRNAKRVIASSILILIAVPLTIFLGFFVFDDTRYYFVSLLIILETTVPFFMVFEGRRPSARELVIISVLCAVAVAGRAAFFMIPQFKPALAIVIIAGICFGGETGFLVGAVTGFVSNFFFGQGPWTPWQMFAFGIIGFVAGVFFSRGFIRRTRLSLCVFGALSTLVFYGGIMNPASVLLAQSSPTPEMFATAYIAGLPFDLIHAASTAFFLWVIGGTMIEKLERVKVKYGLVK